MEIDYNRYNVDFGNRAADYARYRQGFPPEFFRRLARAGVGLPGQRVLDLGTGTGTLARGFVDMGCEALGLDVSEEMLAAARALGGAREGLRFEAGAAEHTGREAGAWQVVSAGQCWHWFSRPQAAAEAWRLLADGGALVVAHMDWLHRPGGVLARSVALARRHHPEYQRPFEWPEHSVYSCWLGDIEAAGFSDIELWSFDVDLVYSPEAWRGRMRASHLVGAALDAARTAAFDAELAALLERELPGERLLVPHRVFTLVARKGAPSRQAPEPPQAPHPQLAPYQGGAWQPAGRDGACLRRVLGRETGATRISCSRYLLPPGAAPFPRHAHLVGEEAILVLGGEGTLEIGEERRVLRAGDYAALPPGEGGAHRLTNTGDRPLDYLCLGTLEAADVVLYPDSGKLGALAGASHGGRPSTRTLAGFWRREDAVEYWEGEP